MSFKIGNIEIKNNVVLAPMAGISNPAFIKIVSELGVSLAYTELISAEAIVRDNKKTFEMLKGIETLNIPIGIQLFGSNAKTLATAAKIISNLYKNAFIDINMGCPVPKVAIKSKAGSALLKEPKKVSEIIKAIVKSVDCPVTAKIRSGWDASSINAVEISKIIEEAGASAITVHPRTRAQGYSGLSNWNIIKEVKENVKIPVIGNGDISSVEDAIRMIDETKCDAVMIGRGALGNPYIFKQIIHYFSYKEILKNQSSKEKIEMCKKHFKYLLDYKNEKVAVLEMRTNAAWYLKGMKDSAHIKREIFKCQTKEELMKILNDYQKELENDEN